MGDSFPSASRTASFAVRGLGATSTIKSINGIIPEFLIGAPANAGTYLFSARASIRPFFISSTEREPFSIYFSIKLSSPSAAASINFSRAAATASFKSAGTASSFSKASPCMMYAFSCRTSTTPLKPPPLPIGSVIATGSTLNFSFMSLNVLAKSAWSLSSLVTKTPLGFFLSLRFLHNLIVSIWTPDFPSTVNSANSAARKLKITAPVKSDEPGVSKRLILVPSFSTWPNAAYIDIFLSISSGL